MSDPAEDTSGPLRLSISEQAYQHLRSKIIAREIEPGTVIGERRLADDLQASRTPLRAAISRLEGEGLVERLTNGSIVIRQISVDELLDILFVRRLLEGEAAFLAAERMDRTVLDRLIAQSREIIAQPDLSFEDFWRYDDGFHEEIARASGKAVLAATILDLRRKARMCHIKRMPGRFGDQAAEHLDVLNAIAAGNGTLARKTMNKHSNRVRARLLKWLSGR